MAATKENAIYEASKENIPLRQRETKNSGIRSTVSQQLEDILVQKKKFYEQEIAKYTGDDPLDLWFTYIKWIEQNYKNDGHDGNICKAIQQCLLVLKNEKRYFNDDRFIAIWIKFATLSKKAFEVYKNMSSRGIGCHCASFYIAWAQEANKLGDISRSLEILNEGIQKNAEPVESLQNALSLFQNNAKSGVAEKLNEDKQVFVCSKGNKNSLLVSQAKDLECNKPLSKLPFKIFNNDTKETAASQKFSEKTKGSSSLSKEEETLPQSHSSQINKKKSYLTSAELKNWKPPTYLYEPPNPMVRPMYDKLKVYGGNEELSFEEIKAAKWLEAQSKAEAERKRLEEENEKKTLQMQVKLLQEKLELLETLALPVLQQNRKDSLTDSQNSQFQCSSSNPDARMLTNSNTTSENKHSSKTEPTFLRELSKNCPLPSNSTYVDVSKFSLPDLGEIPEKNKILASTNSLSLPSLTLNTNTSALSHKPSKDEPTFLRELSQNFHCSYDSTKDSIAKHPSLKNTFIAKEVDCMMQELYNGTLRTEVGPSDDLSFKIDFANNSYSLYEANEEKSTSKIPDNVTDKPKGFIIYNDPTELLPQNINAPAFPIFHDVLVNDENLPPVNLPKESKIQKESTSPKFLRADDDDDKIAIEYFQNNQVLDYNMTFLNEEKFAASARATSTPCIKQKSIGVRDLSTPMQAHPISENNVPFDLNFCNSTLIEILKDAFTFADSDKVKEILKQIVFDIPMIKNAKSTKESYFNIVKQLKLANEYTRSEKLRSVLQNCAAAIEANVEKLKDFCQTNTSPGQTLQLSTIMEASHESKSSSSSSSCTGSLKQRSTFTHLNSITDTCEKSKPIQKFDSHLTENSKLETMNSEKPKSVTLTECNIDPFDPKTTSTLLKTIVTPVSDRENFYDCKDIPFNIKIGSTIKLGDIQCVVEKKYNEGAYAKVYCANCTKSSLIGYNKILTPHQKLALKVCKNTNEWEFYIYSELAHRLAKINIIPNIQNSILKIHSAIAYQNSFVLISDFYERGTLLDVVNVYKIKNTRVPECITMFFALELLHIVSGLHKCNIVHGDIKPDNFLISDISAINNISSVLNQPFCLRLIDFGRSIDLALFEPGITFSVVVKTENFQCVQMKEGRPWVFETDWYGVLNCIHILLFSEYMNVSKNANNLWEPNQKFKRYFQTDIWQPLFQTLLNIPSCYEIPNLTPFINALSQRLQKQTEDLKMQIIKLSIALMNKPCSGR